MRRHHVAGLVALAIAVAAAAPAPARAGGVRIVIGAGPLPAPNARRLHPHLNVPRGHGFLHGRPVVVPQPVWVVPTPVYVAPRCVVPGYWAYQWVPQTSTYEMWVPGAWSPDGTWIEGHYETRAWTTGYWQPYWVDARPC